MAKSSKVKSSNPFTPVRKLFLKFDLYNQTIALGKRHRDRDSSDHEIPGNFLNGNFNGAHSHSSARQRSQSLPTDGRVSLQVTGCPKPACMALQNEDPSEDVIIITALDTIPFCCHEDLLTMSREQLIAAANSLNAKLPAALQINIHPSQADNSIRNSIELVVGLRRDVPPAPKPVRSHSQSETLDVNKSPPTSPLAMRSRSYDLYTALGSPKLARLDEEDEDAMVVDRPLKKRKVSRPVPEEAENYDRMEIDTDIMLTPTPLPRILRTRSHSVTPVRTASPKSKRVLRSHSQQLPHDTRRINIDPAFITSTRPRYRYRNKPRKSSGSVNTTVLRQNGPNNVSRLSMVGPTRERSTSTVDQEGNASATSCSPGLTASNSIADSVGSIGRQDLLKRKLAGVDAEVTAGIYGMSMGADIDVC